jgi:hypothetical protein
MPNVDADKAAITILFETLEEQGTHPLDLRDAAYHAATIAPKGKVSELIRAVAENLYG